jgi:hypothetical protein
VPQTEIGVLGGVARRTGGEGGEEGEGELGGGGLGFAEQLNSPSCPKREGDRPQSDRSGTYLQMCADFVATPPRDLQAWQSNKLDHAPSISHRPASDNYELWKTLTPVPKLRIQIIKIRI